MSDDYVDDLEQILSNAAQEPPSEGHYRST